MDQLERWRSTAIMWYIVCNNAVKLDSYTVHLQHRACWVFSWIYLLTENCKVFATPHDISLALLLGWPAPSLQSLCTAIKTNRITQIHSGPDEHQGQQGNSCCLNAGKCSVTKVITWTDKQSWLIQKIHKKRSKYFHTLTSSLWLMARAECSKALMTEV